MSFNCTNTVMRGLPGQKTGTALTHRILAFLLCRSMLAPYAAISAKNTVNITVKRVFLC
jgi:hypothetical protein